MCDLRDRRIGEVHNVEDGNFRKLVVLPELPLAQNEAFPVPSLLVAKMRCHASTGPAGFQEEAVKDDNNDLVGYIHCSVLEKRSFFLADVDVAIADEPQSKSLPGYKREWLLDSRRGVGNIAKDPADSPHHDNVELRELHKYGLAGFSDAKDATEESGVGVRALAAADDV